MSVTTLTKTEPSFSWRLKADQPEHAPLLDLPVELLYDIIDLLPLHSQAMLAQSSSDLRAVSKEGAMQSVLAAPKQERIAYLKLREKTMPQHRLCYMCLRLHKLEV